MIDTLDKEDWKKSGVYKILNTINGDFYIGSAKFFRRRFTLHKRQLIDNVSRNTILQRAVNKYGIENFKFEVVEFTEDFANREVAIILELDPKYNIRKGLSYSGGLSNINMLGKPSLFKGRTHSLESKAKMSATRTGIESPNKGKKYHSWQRTNVKSVISNNNGELLTHRTAIEAAKYFGFGVSSVYQCCLNMRANIKGVIFQYSNSQENVQETSSSTNTSY